MQLPLRRRLSVLLLGTMLALPCPAAAGSGAGPVETRLAEELLASLGPTVPPDAQVALTLGRPFDGPVDAVRDIGLDPRTGIFTARILSNGHPVELSGRADVEVTMPVPVRRIRPGEVIEPSDLTTMRLSLDRAGAGFIASADALVGQSPRRQLSAGRLVQVGSVGAPIVVQRNRPVTLVYEDGALMLAARGRALQEGGVGDTVRVMNIASSTVVTGTVTGSETVSVSGPRLPQAGRP
ncbi:flagellar basal body P-ring formation chaperone FlgA [Azospirillum sp. B506]|uniref:flagellar basal body P-ring formation chaperone FlgA n=1 Tax=Azospirillum sp. B506 TaxID=137721 RepID=UPI001FCB556F|nr:flagellar basal body P-ring formation chaperone FlgA [Azospirillum sp. B506]